MTWLDAAISLYKGAASPQPLRSIPAGQVLQEIQVGKYRSQILAMREVAEKAHRAWVDRRNGEGKKTDIEHQYEKIKKRLAAVTWSGTFTHRAADQLTAHSGLLVLDIDHIETDEMRQLRQSLQQESFTAFCFTSPSGHGLKVGIRTQEANHLEAFHGASWYLREVYDLVVDPSGKDVSRLCFVSFDPDLYINDHAELFAVEERRLDGPSVLTDADDGIRQSRSAARMATQAPPQVSTRPTERSGERLALVSATYDEVRRMLQCIPARPEYDTWLRIISAIGSSFSEADTIALCSEWSPEETPGEYAAKYQNRLSGISIGTLIYMAREHGYTPQRPGGERSDPQRAPPSIVPAHVNGQSNGHQRVSLRQQEHGEEIEQEAVESTVFTPDWFNRPPETRPVLTMNGNRIGSVGNLTAIIAAPGSGKSAVCEALCAQRLNQHADSFNLAVDTDRTVIYIDTERSKGDHWGSWYRMTRRAGIEHGEVVPDTVWFRLFALVPKVDDRRRLLQEYFTSTELGLLILDGIGDFVHDPNDAAECNDFIFWLMAEAKQGDFAVLTTIHHNPAPGNEKARGHLGSELMRRAEAVLLLKRDAETQQRTLTTNFSFGKVRNATDINETFFAWNDALSMFSSCEDAVTPPSGSLLDLISLVEDLYAEKSAYYYADLKQLVMDRTGTKERNAEKKITRMRKEGLVFTDAAGLWIKVRTNDRNPF